MSNYTRKAVQAYLVILLGGAIGLTVLAAISPSEQGSIADRIKKRVWNCEKFDVRIKCMNQEYPITKYNDLRKPPSNVLLDRPPCTNIDTCREEK